MRIIFILIILINMSFGCNLKCQYRKEINNLDIEQMIVLHYSFVSGNEFNMGYILSAIAWKESKFGKWGMNLSDGKYGSFSPYHILLESSASRAKCNNDWCRSRLAERLYSDIEFSASEALAELLFWKKYWNKKNDKTHIMRMIGSYNAGFRSVDSINGKKYYNDILLRIEVLKEYFIEYDLNNVILS